MSSSGFTWPLTLATPRCSHGQSGRQNPAFRQRHFIGGNPADRRGTERGGDQDLLGAGVTVFFHIENYAFCTLFDLWFISRPTRLVAKPAAVSPQHGGVRGFACRRTPNSGVLLCYRQNCQILN